MKKQSGLVLICLSIISFTTFTFSQTVGRTDAEYLAEIQKRIAGREDEPAEKVFQNIELLRGKKASRLPGMMEALTGLLGVNCAHCHTPGHWEADDKKPKVIAKQHFDMQSAILKQYFNDENKITCWTCHRGKPTVEILPPD